MADDGDKQTSRHVRKAYAPTRRHADSGGDDGRRTTDRWERSKEAKEAAQRGVERERYSSRRCYDGDERRSRKEDRRRFESRDERHAAGSSRRSAREDGERTRTARSRSPTNFAHDRAKERDSYARKYGLSTEEEESGTRMSEAQGNKRQSEPDFGSSGLLAKESNSKNGVTLKYFEPPEGRKPKKKWRLYVFQDGKESDILHISRQSCYLLGRDLAVADIPIEHASVSKQHAVVQYRSMSARNEFGDEKQSIKPFLIDLESANGTFVNDKEIPPSRFYELKSGDAIRIGGYERELILLMED